MDYENVNDLLLTPTVILSELLKGYQIGKIPTEETRLTTYSNNTNSL